MLSLPRLRTTRVPRSNPPEQKASAVGALIAMQSGGRAIWTPRDLGSLTRQSYISNAIAHRCVRIIAESAATLPLTLRQGSAILESHPVLDLLSRPNPAQDRCAFFEMLYGHLQIAGNTYVEAVGSGAGIAPRELHVLRPDRVRVVPGESGWPAAYEYRVANRTHRFAVLEGVSPILHLRSFHPLDDHYGLSPLEAAAVPVDIHNAASRWNKALLDNAARPSGAVIYTGPDGASLSESQYARLREQLETSHQGAANAGRPILLEGGLDWKAMSFSPSDMEFMRAKDSAAREIALAFGVPPLMLGLPGDNTHANYAEANRAFISQTIRPIVRKAASALSGWLVNFYGEDLTLEIEISEGAPDGELAN